MRNLSAALQSAQEADTKYAIFRLLANNTHWSWSTVYAAASTWYPAAWCAYGNDFLVVMVSSNNLYYKVFSDLSTGWDTGWTQINTDTVPTWYSVDLIAGAQPMLVYGYVDGLNNYIKTLNWDGSNWINARIVDSWADANQTPLCCGIYNYQSLVLYQKSLEIYGGWSTGGGAWSDFPWDLRGVWGTSSITQSAPVPRGGLNDGFYTHFFFSARPRQYANSGAVEDADGMRLYTCRAARVFGEGEADRLGVLSDFAMAADQAAALFEITQINNLYWACITSRISIPNVDGPDVPQPRQNYLIVSPDGEHWSGPVVYTPVVPFGCLVDGDYFYVLGSDADDGWKLKIHRSPLTALSGAAASDAYSDYAPEWSLNLPDGGTAAQLTFSLNNPDGIFNNHNLVQEGQQVQLQVGWCSDNQPQQHSHTDDEYITIFQGELDAPSQSTDYGAGQNAIAISAMDGIAKLKQYTFDRVLTITSQTPQRVDFNEADNPNFVEVSGIWNLSNGEYVSTYDGQTYWNFTLEAGLRWGLNEWNRFGVKFDHDPEQNIVERAGMMFRVSFNKPDNNDAQYITTITNGYAVIVQPNTTASGWDGTVDILLQQWDGSTWSTPTGAGVSSLSGLTHAASTYLYILFRTWYNQVQVWYSTDQITWTFTNIDFTFSSCLPQGELGFVASLISSPVGVDIYEDDNTFAAAQEISVGSAQTHNFYDAGDVDWIKFSATNSITYVIETFNGGSQANTVVDLYNSSNVFIQNLHAGVGTGGGTYTATYTGDYYVRISPNAGETGMDTYYDVRVYQDGSTPPVSADASPGAYQSVYFDEYYNCTQSIDRDVEFLIKEFAIKAGLMNVQMQSLAEYDFDAASEADDFSLINGTGKTVTGGQLQFTHNAGDYANCWLTNNAELGSSFLIKWRSSPDNGLIDVCATDANFNDGYNIRVAVGDISTSRVQIYQNRTTLLWDIYPRIAIQSGVIYEWTLSYHLPGWLSLWMNGRLLFTIYDNRATDRTANYWSFIAHSSGTAQIDYVHIPAAYQRYALATINPNDTCEKWIQALSQMSAPLTYFVDGDILYVARGVPDTANADVWDSGISKPTYQDELLSASKTRDNTEWVSHVRVVGQDGLYWGDAYDSDIQSTKGYRFAQETISELTSVEDCINAAEDILAERNRFLYNEDWTGFLDLRLQRHDRIRIINSEDGTDGDFLIASIDLSGSYADAAADMNIATKALS